jgi:lipopolysaccharide transport system permease protein
VVPAVDFLLAGVVLGGLMVWFSTPVGPYVFLLPAFFALAAMTAFGVGLFFAAVNVRFRDVPYTIPFLLQIWMFLSPVVYPVSALPERWQWLLSLNPMTLVIDGFRWCLLDRPAPDPAQAAISVVSALVLFVVGLAYFRANEARFADTI